MYVGCIEMDLDGKKLVTFVCVGNSGRSPMAEAVLRFRLKEKGIDGFKVMSAGIFATPYSYTADETVNALKLFGIDSVEKKSKRLDEEILTQSDFVIAAEGSIKRHIMQNYSPAHHGKIYAFGEITGKADIDDPWGRGFPAYKNLARRLLYQIDLVIDFLQRSE